MERPSVTLQWWGLLLFLLTATQFSGYASSQSTVTYGDAGCDPQANTSTGCIITGERVQARTCTGCVISETVRIYQWELIPTGVTVAQVVTFTGSDKKVSTTTISNSLDPADRSALITTTVLSNDLQGTTTITAPTVFATFSKQLIRVDSCGTISLLADFGHGEYYSVFKELGPTATFPATSGKPASTGIATDLEGQLTTRIPSVIFNRLPSSLLSGCDTDGHGIATTKSFAEAVIINIVSALGGLGKPVSTSGPGSPRRQLRRNVDVLHASPASRPRGPASIPTAQ